MNRDFVEMLCALNDASAEYLVVGAHDRGKVRFPVVVSVAVGVDVAGQP